MSVQITRIGDCKFNKGKGNLEMDVEMTITDDKGAEIYCYVGDLHIPIPEHVWEQTKSHFMRNY